jgi:type I restriction enzyme S subunit
MAETTLREICHLITDGKHGDCQNEDNSGYYFISAKDVRDWKISYENSREITQLDFEDTHRRTRFEPCDIVVVSTGANIGDVAIAKDEPRTYKTTFQKSVAILKPIKEKVNPHYLAYFLSNSRTLLHNISSGSAQKNLLLKDLRNIKIDLPELSVQNKIASILSAYDDLVENNLQRVKHLEEMISNKFELLFIKPTSIETPILQVADFVKGFEPGTNNYLEVPSSDTIPFLRVGDLNKRDSSIFINKELAPHVVAKNEDILLSLDGTVGLVKTGLYGAYSTGVRKVVSKSPLHKAYIYAYLKSQHGQNTINTFARGSTILHAGSAIPKMKIRLPEKKLMEKFAAFGNPSLELIINLIKQNKMLQEARDILLPRLMTGIIKV